MVKFSLTKSVKVNNIHLTFNTLAGQPVRIHNTQLEIQATGRGKVHVYLEVRQIWAKKYFQLY